MRFILTILLLLGLLPAFSQSVYPIRTDTLRVYSGSPNAPTLKLEATAGAANNWYLYTNPSLTSKVGGSGRLMGAPAAAANEFVLRDQLTDSLSGRTFDASRIVSGVFAPARLGSGTGSNMNFLRGDGAWTNTLTGGFTSGGLFISNNGTVQSFQGITGGTVGSTGTLTNHDFNFYTNNSYRGTVNAAGRWQLGPALTDNTRRLQVNGGGSFTMPVTGVAATLSTEYITLEQLIDSIAAGGGSVTWQQSTDAGNTTTNAVSIKGNNNSTGLGLGLNLKYFDENFSPPYGTAFISAGDSDDPSMRGGMAIVGSQTSIQGIENLLLSGGTGTSQIEMRHNGVDGEILFTSTGEDGSISIFATGANNGNVIVQGMGLVELRSANLMNFYTAGEPVVFLDLDGPNPFVRARGDKAQDPEDFTTKFQLDSVAAAISLDQVLTNGNLSLQPAQLGGLVVTDGTDQILLDPINGPGGTGLIGATTSLNFYTATENRMRILANGNIGVGAVSPTSTMHIGGSFAAALRVVTIGTTLDGDDFTLAVNNTTDVDITLPSAASCPGRIYTIKKISNNANTVTILPDGSDEIDGSVDQIISTVWAHIIIQSMGAGGWIMLSSPL